jgi:hypothetical protein
LSHTEDDREILEEDLLQDLRTDRRIILNYIKEIGWEVVNRANVSSWTRLHDFVQSCEYSKTTKTPDDERYDRSKHVEWI